VCTVKTPDDGRRKSLEHVEFLYQKYIWEITSSTWFYYKKLIVPSWSCSQAVGKPVWHIPLLCVQWKTLDDVQRNCPKHVEFYSTNKFEKLVHLVGFIIWIYHDARSHERHIRLFSVNYAIKCHIRYTVSCLFYFHFSPMVARQSHWPNPNNGCKRLRNNGIAGRDDDAQRGKEEARK